MGYKAGMTTIVRDLDRPGAKLHKKNRASLQSAKRPAAAAAG